MILEPDGALPVSGIARSGRNQRTRFLLSRLFLSSDKGSMCYASRRWQCSRFDSTYQVSEGVTLWGCSRRRGSDSRWRMEVRHAHPTSE